MSRQKAASLTKNSPKYSAPACSITKKQLVDGLATAAKTLFKMPTSPRGWVLSKPPHHNQSGGQLRPFQYVNSGWFRSTMDGTPLCSGSRPSLTRRFKLGLFLKLVHSYTFTCKMSISTCQMETPRATPYSFQYSQGRGQRGRSLPTRCPSSITDRQAPTLCRATSVVPSKVNVARGHFFTCSSSLAKI